ncbi:Peroxidase 12 [Acorus gramineus]|uniref:Peroxidase 12 n=1 Tax=Acorus gramineus TaxID=55184 RepID=A0AAV9AHP6_ACOGR|nr:Peroxidase 12 [Acorus gramineus]
MCEAQTAPPLVKGLNYTFYKTTCPNLESIITKQLKSAFRNNSGLAAGLLRLHFHDCFVQGCDGSVLLDGSASTPSEKASPPNLTLRPAAFAMINTLRNLIQKACGRVVSCADITALAARDAVALVSFYTFFPQKSKSFMGSDPIRSKNHQYHPLHICEHRVTLVLTSPFLI